MYRLDAIFGFRRGIGRMEGDVGRRGVGFVEVIDRRVGEAGAVELRSGFKVKIANLGSGDDIAFIDRGSTPLRVAEIQDAILGFGQGIDPELFDGTVGVGTHQTDQIQRIAGVNGIFDVLRLRGEVHPIGSQHHRSGSGIGNAVIVRG